MSADVHDRTPVVKIELQLRPSPPADARPHWHGYGCLAFYDGPAYAEGRVVTVWENDLHLMAERSSWSAKVEQRDGSGWVLVLRLVHEKAREALAALNLPDFIAPAVAGEPESTPATELPFRSYPEFLRRFLPEEAERRRRAGMTPSDVAQEIGREAAAEALAAFTRAADTQEAP